MKRRHFLMGALGAAALAPARAFAKPKKFRLKMVTTWPARMPILQEAADLFAKRVKSASGGNLKIKVFAGN